MKPKVCVVLPVYNEERALPNSVGKLYSFLKSFKYPWEIIIADNASTDTTWQKAQELARKYKKVRAVHLTKKGRGRALRKTWTHSKADILAYMDVDLSTDLKALPHLVKAIADQEYDIAIGSRLISGAVIMRGPKREILSRGYNSLVRWLLNTQVKDMQCGFKAIHRRIAKKIVPRIQDNEWFFDTELIILAERAGYKIKEVPVTWNDDPDSRMKITSTVTNYLRSVWRLRQRNKK